MSLHRNPFEATAAAADIGDAKGGSCRSDGSRGGLLAMSQTTYSSLFPAWLSSWMTPGVRDDEGSGAEGSNPFDFDSDDQEGSVYLDCHSHASSLTDEEHDERTSLLLDHHYYYSLPTRKQSDGTLRDALGSWLAPWADAARRKAERNHGAGPKVNDGNDAADGLNSRDDGVATPRTVRFESGNHEAEGTEKSRRRYLCRVSSSPALLTALSDDGYSNSTEIDATTRRKVSGFSAIVLKEIDLESDSPADDAPDSIHPWTKLILLEELGTAWSWFVLLLPWAFLILALVLDGNSELKHVAIKVNGATSCADIQTTMPPPFDESANGYYAVPFWLSETSAGSCNYPYELRRGVGLLSNGTTMLDLNYTKMMSTKPASKEISIVDTRYQYLMSHGSAFTTGVLENVPPTAESLIASVRLSNVSTSALALVARGSVQVSVVVFQRPAGQTDNETTNMRQWTPVVILSARKLDLACKFNNQASTWTCYNRQLIDVYFSLPNAAVLLGGDLRVEVLLSHHKTRSHSEPWFDGGMIDDDYIEGGPLGPILLSRAEQLLSSADVSRPQTLLRELSTKSEYNILHVSQSYNDLTEYTRVITLCITAVFIFYWMKCMRVDSHSSMEGIAIGLFPKWKRAERRQLYWWEDPWASFPERRYLLLLLVSLVLLQNPLLVYAYFRPRHCYGSPIFRFLADSISGLSIQLILFLWVSLVHGLRYHTADMYRRRFEQHKRVLELLEATKHLTQGPDKEGMVESSISDRVTKYSREYGYVEGTGTAQSSALLMKHDPNSDSYVEFMFPKLTLLVLGSISTIASAATRVNMSSESLNPNSAASLNPDRFDRRTRIYISSSILQICVIQCWALLIIYTNIVTGERLRKEPFLSTRPAQLSYRVLSSILLLGSGCCVVLFYLHWGHAFVLEKPPVSDMGVGLTYDTSLGGDADTLGSKAEMFFGFIRRVMSQIPYVGTTSSAGNLLYATACSMVVANMFLPSSLFRPSPKRERFGAEEVSAEREKKLLGTDKRFVVSLAKATHTWRVFPLPMRSHYLLSQHTLKENLQIVGTFQLDGHFNMHRLKFGRGAIYKGRYTPVFCIELACWLLEASWQAYYSTQFSVINGIPGRMSLDSIGLKLERFIEEKDTDTHVYVASNVSAQVEGEEDTIIVVSFRGSASKTNVLTDLEFEQVPLSEDIVSSIPAFILTPGMPIAINKNVWKPRAGSRSIFNEVSSSAAVSSSLNQDVHHFTNAVSIGAKAVLRATPLARQTLACVHKGFLTSYNSVRHELIEAIVAVLKRQLDNVVVSNRNSSPGEPLTLPKIYLTGHSLGGCLAQILALDLASNCEINIHQPISEGTIVEGLGVPACTSKDSFSVHSMDEEASRIWLGESLAQSRNTPTKLMRLRPALAVYTYGQPRVGNLAFKTVYKSRVPHTFRVITEGDAITSILTVGKGFSGIYRHAGLEVLLEDGCTGNILVGPTVVETLLRFTKVRTSMTAHFMDRYRESLESALSGAELKEYYSGHGGKVTHEKNRIGLLHQGTSALPSWVTNVKRSRS